jgi:hypothetical protein
VRRPASPHLPASTSAAWLAELNKYREAGGVEAVSEEPAWSAGIENHLTYLENTPAEYFIGAYASAHTENPASPFYTAIGAREAGFSDLTEGDASTGVSAIDTWWTAPFHAIGMLRPQLSRVALGIHPGSGDAGLDVIQGIDWNRPKPGAPVLFPGSGVTTNLTEFDAGEVPTPLETCGWQALGTVGLPLIALLPSAPGTNLSASLLGPTRAIEASADGELCAVDERNYSSTDPVYGESGRSILASDHAVLLIPRHPLVDGSYEARIQQPGQPDINWSFVVSVPPPTAIAPPSIGGVSVEGQTIYALRGLWSGKPNRYAYQWLRCDTTGGNCIAIPGAGSGEYILQASDVGSTLRVQETAGNPSGLGSPATSDPSPIVTTPPSITTGGSGAGFSSNQVTGAARGARPLILRIALSVRRGRALLHAPTGFPAGLPLRVTVARQIRLCRAGHRRCYWRTTGFGSRMRYTTGHETRFSIPVPSRHGRVRVVVSLLPFTFAGWSYPRVNIVGLVY